MKVYRITISPLSNFGTPLKGDTIFGHICWQLFYKKELLGKDLSELLKDYTRDPFIIVSSAYLEIGDTLLLKRPDMPLEALFDLKSKDVKEIIKERKELKKKKWVSVNKKSKIISFKFQRYLNEGEIIHEIMESLSFYDRRELMKKRISAVVKEFSHPHNTINRITGTTGEGQFAPFSIEELAYLPGISLNLFIGIRDDLHIEGVIEALRVIGQTGFGKDASTGLGRFEVNKYEEFDLRDIGSEEPNACYTLSPCVPEMDAFGKIFFSPFIRFGRHGDILAKTGRPFKNPVIMADEGAVFVVNNVDVFAKPYIGTAVTGISKAKPEAVTQGYSLYIPVRVEVENEEPGL